MKTAPNYKLRKAEPRDLLSDINLLPPIPYKGSELDIAIFGPHTYISNLENMKKRYYHSNQHLSISFTPATTSESIFTAAYILEDNIDKPQIFDSKWLQAGNIVKTQDGVFTNTQITNEYYLKQLLNRAEKVNGIYLINSDVGFAPYESFSTGLMDSGDFAEGGLARALEHTNEKSAKNLGEISYTKFYPKRVNVFGFDEVDKPILTFVGLSFGGCSNVDGLGIYGGGRLCIIGCAFGVLNADVEGVAPKNSS